ncbi:hypothetical protein C6497_04910 [Candidatus Poribacteria bacterium]|nr:MAG: hypothetical protein C6497_04910 [Candidatus Poribacteria bacterium]
MKVEQLHGPAVKPSQVVELEYLIQCDSPEVFGIHGLQKEGNVIITRAPARLDIMGGIADYSGSNVFEMTLNRAAVVACQKREDRNLRALTIQHEGEIRPYFQITLDDFYTDGSLKSYSEINCLFNNEPKTSWSGYILGCFYTLLKENKVQDFPHGAAIVIKSDIPMGAGIASSAAIEVATISAINHLYNLKLDGFDIARLAQIVENKIVGAPCGIMDQLTSAVGTHGKILSILCQPDKILESVEIPDQVSFLGIHTKVPRSTKSTAYIDTRTAAFMGLRILKDELKWDKLNDNYLCHITVQEFQEHCLPLLPNEMKGSEFLKKYDDTDDTATVVDPNKVYAVKDRVKHPVYENDRVRKFIRAIKNTNKYPQNTPKYLSEAGTLMYESNDSYRDFAGLGSKEIDGLVNIARKIGEDAGIYGAKITGGGGGGTVALLCYKDVSMALTQIISAYKLAWGIDTEIFIGSTYGACEFGHILWRLEESEQPVHF